MSAPKSLYASMARFLTRDEAESLAKRVLGFATAEETRVTIQSGSQGNTRFAVNQISTAGDNFDTNVTVRSAFGKKSAFSSTNKLDDASLKAMVETSERLAKLSPDDPEAMPELGPQTIKPEIDWSDATASVDPTGRATMVSQITGPVRGENLVCTGYLEVNTGSLAIANNKGLFAYGRATSTALTSTVRTPEGTGSGWAGATSWNVADINPADIAARAIEKAKRSVNAVAIEPGRYTVILEPTAVGNLVQLIGFNLNARNADEGRSFFTKPGGGNKIGMKVVDERVTLYSDPQEAASASNTFTFEGLPVERTVWIENGVVKNLAYDRFWAQKTGTQPTPFTGSLAMTGGTATIEEMIASTQRGLLVTRFWYIRPVDPRTILFTGLTRDGTFLIENGKITRAVKNLRYNESPIFMLNNIEMMGRPMRVPSSESGSPDSAVVMPPLKVRDFTFTSLSDAV
jgi:predicted Zn-dependent protease